VEEQLGRGICQTFDNLFYQIRWSHRMKHAKRSQKERGFLESQVMSSDSFDYPVSLSVHFIKGRKAD
jgi:hypothetical protein